MSKRSYKQGEILEIEWDDASTTQNWHSPNCKRLSENHGLARCKTVGYFVRESKRAIQVSKCIGDDGDMCDTQSIPVGSIRIIKRKK